MNLSCSLFKCAAIFEPFVTGSGHRLSPVLLSTPVLILLFSPVAAEAFAQAVALTSRYIVISPTSQMADFPTRKYSQRPHVTNPLSCQVVVLASDRSVHILTCSSTHTITPTSRFIANFTFNRAMWATLQVSDSTSAHTLTSTIEPNHHLDKQ